MHQRHERGAHLATRTASSSWLAVGLTCAHPDPRDAHAARAHARAWNTRTPTPFSNALRFRFESTRFHKTRKRTHAFSATHREVVVLHIVPKRLTLSTDAGTHNRETPTTPLFLYHATIDTGWGSAGAGGCERKGPWGPQQG